MCPASVGFMNDKFITRIDNIEKMTKKTTTSPKKSTSKTVRKKAAPAYRYPITSDAAESERFRAAISDWRGLARSDPDNESLQIGVLGEKSLHSILKRFITDRNECCEIPILSNNEKDKHRYIADVCMDGKIYEIQTGGFYPLIPKLTYYLTETDYDVTVVHPIPRIRYKVWIDPETGALQSRKKSPKTGKAEDALREIFWIRHLLSHERLHIRLLFLEEEEYRYLNGWSYDKKRGSERCERVPAALLGAVDLKGADDYRLFLSDELPNAFTAAELGRALGLSGKAVYCALKIFLTLGYFEAIGKRGRSVLYGKTERMLSDSAMHADCPLKDSFMETIESEDLNE